MEEKNYKKLISTYIQVTLGFIGITSSLLIPLLITYYFQYFLIASEIESLSAEQLNYINSNLTSLIASIFTFIGALFISLFLFAKSSFSARKIKQTRTDFLLKCILAIIIVGFVFLVISLGFFLMAFIPNNYYVFGVIFLVGFVLTLVILGIYVISYH